MAGFAQSNDIQVPQPRKLLVHTYAKGVQVYICTQDAKDTTNYIWTLKEPFANLYTDTTYNKPIGKHYFTDGKIPTWESADGSKVRGGKVAQVNSPDGNSIPWLLLKASANAGTGVLGQVIYIQRINTNGGKAPDNATKEQKGQLLNVLYTAEYLFYGRN